MDVIEVAGVQRLVPFRSPVPHSAEMVSQHANRHGPAAGMTREIRYVALDLSVQIDPTGLDELQQCCTGERLSNAGDTERHPRIGGNAALHAGESGSFTKHGVPVVANADRDGGVLLSGLKLGHHTPKGGQGIRT